MQSEKQVLIFISTTTSLYQVGLLDDLLSDFKNSSRINVEFKILVKGSGEALRLLVDGSSCIAFTHAPSLEKTYLEQGKIERLTIFAHNEFIIVGPRDDPANVSSADNAIDAFKRIFNAGVSGKVLFVSRSDLSGTHVRELMLWSLIGVKPHGNWYLRTGQGMTQTLLIADNLNAYTLVDEGTWRTLREQGKIRNLVELKRDPRLLINVYSVYLSKAPNCRENSILEVAYKLKEYLMTRGQELLEIKYRDKFRSVKDKIEQVIEAWSTLSNIIVVE
ncbi:MAG: substrate-binding domain-containing protein [Desulfurococcaceae archaeon]|jgi:tungstate transport system substrate-binding protein|nr:substrate-binding domain-containing protein [Desulfurococcaceae archaeon]